jgi:hypothetical protein
VLDCAIRHGSADSGTERAIEHVVVGESPRSLGK